MKKVLLALSIVTCGFVAKSQQDPQFSNFMYDRLSINPGFAGIDDKLCGTMFYRNQWMGFGGGNEAIQPRTFLLNVHAPVKVAFGGVGLTFFSDKLGFQSNTVIRLSYAYHLSLGPKMKLGLGISAGYIGVGYNATWVAVDGVDNDDAIPSSTSGAGTFDLGFGAYLKGQDFYVGLSSTHLTESELKNTSQLLSFKNKRHYYLMGGYDYKIQNTDFAVLPALRMETDAVATQFDVSVRGMWKDMVWLGAGYRIKDAFYPMVGVQKQLGKVGSMAKFGLSYDITTSDIKNYSNNGLEFFVNYCMPLEKPYKPEKYKTVRFL